jgi:hypothetical protein
LKANDLQNNFSFSLDIFYFVSTRWFKDLCPKSINGVWLPVPSEVTTKLRIMPNLLRLTWGDKPMAFEADKGWGYYMTADEHKKITEKKKRSKKKGQEGNQVNNNPSHVFVKIPHKVNTFILITNLNCSKMTHTLLIRTEIK